MSTPPNSAPRPELRLDTLTDLQLERILYELRKLHELLSARHPHFADHIHLKAVLTTINAILDELPQPHDAAE